METKSSILFVYLVESGVKLSSKFRVAQKGGGTRIHLSTTKITEGLVYLAHKVKRADVPLLQGFKFAVFYWFSL